MVVEAPSFPLETTRRNTCVGCCQLNDYSLARRQITRDSLALTAGLWMALRNISIHPYTFDSSTRAHVSSPRRLWAHYFQNFPGSIHDLLPAARQTMEASSHGSLFTRAAPEPASAASPSALSLSSQYGRPQSAITGGSVAYSELARANVSQELQSSAATSAPSGPVHGTAQGVSGTVAMLQQVSNRSTH